MTTSTNSSEIKKPGTRWTSVLLVIALVAIAITVFALKARRSTAGAPTAESAEPPMPVKTEAIGEAVLPTSLRLAGTLRGNRETDLAANASGRITETYVERGATVKSGQLLAKIDVREAALAATQARAEAASARVQEDQAKIECERFEKLKKQGVVSDSEYQARLTQCRALPHAAQAASARASLAAKNVGDGMIRAPFAGVVTERYVEVGQFVRDDSRVVTLVSLDQLRLEFAVPEADIARVHEGMPVAFRVAAFETRRFEARVRFISGAVRQDTRDLTVEALVENSNGLLKSGMFADVELITGKRKLPAVPKAALIENDGRFHAFFLVDERLEERILSLGPESEGRIGVLKGARPGDQLVVGDLKKLTNGQRAVATRN
jgi:RND family efflux transporter MFP subunit